MKSSKKFDDELSKHLGKFRVQLKIRWATIREKLRARRDRNL